MVHARAVAVLWMVVMGVVVQGSSLQAGLAADGRFGRFLGLLRDGNLTGLLAGAGADVILFAPTDEAFENLSESTLWEMKVDADFLTNVVQTMIVRARYTGADLATLDELTAMSGEKLKIDKNSVGEPFIRQRRGRVFIGFPSISSQEQVIHPVSNFVLPNSHDYETIDNFLRRNKDFSIFYDFLKQVNLLDQLKVEPSGELTVLAPANGAFASVAPSIMQQLRNEPRLLRAVVLSHLVPHRVQVGAGPTVYENLLNELVAFRMVRGAPHANLAPLAGPPTAVGARGRVYRLRGLILPSIGAIGGSTMPPTLDTAGTLRAQGFTLYSELLDQAGLTAELSAEGGVTALAPTNAALSALPTAEARRLATDLDALRSTLSRTLVPGPLPPFTPDRLLRALDNSTLRLNVYHKPGGETVRTANGAAVGAATATTSGAVLPTAALPPAAAASLRRLLQGMPELSSFLAAAQAADLSHVLAGDGPVTVFAPTNAAFARLSADVFFSALTSPRQLADSVRGQIVASGQTLYSPGLCWAAFTPLNGRQVAAGLRADGALVLYRADGSASGASLLRRDLPAANGVLHVVDALF